MNPPQQILILAKAIEQEGGQLWIVGGSVRDAQLGIDPTDWDIEVYGMSVEHLKSTLEKLGRAKWVGKFLHLKAKIQGMQLDVAIPMIDGQVSPYTTIEQAAHRRDLTMNAIAYDPLKHEKLIHFMAQEYSNSILRAVDSTKFGVDPLRVLRVARFAAIRNLGPKSHSLICVRAFVWTMWLLKELDMNRSDMAKKTPIDRVEMIDKIKVFARFPQWRFDIHDIKERVDRAANKRSGVLKDDLSLMDLFFSRPTQPRRWRSIDAVSYLKRWIGP